MLRAKRQTGVAMSGRDTHPIRITADLRTLVSSAVHPVQESAMYAGQVLDRNGGVCLEVRSVARRPDPRGDRCLQEGGQDQSAVAKDDDVPAPTERKAPPTARLETTDASSRR